MEDNNEGILNKKKEIDENYEKCQKILIELNEKRERFIKELDDSRNDQQSLMKQLTEVNTNIEDYKSKIDNFVKNNPKLDFNELEKKCQQIISRFYDDLSMSSLKY